MMKSPSADQRAKSGSAPPRTIYVDWRAYHSSPSYKANVDGMLQKGYRLRNP